MRDCKRHPSQSQPGDGVCPSCLQERLVWLWRGESFRLGDDPASATAASQQKGDGDPPPPPRPLQQGVGSLASVRKQLQVNGVAKSEIGDPRNNGEDGDAVATTTTTETKPSVIVEWAEFHARRRRKQGLDSSSSAPMAQISRSLDSLEFKPLVERLMVDTDTAARSRVSIPGKIRSRSMPLDNRSAEETALRVIREVQADHLYSDELDFLDTVDGGLKTPEQQQRRRSNICLASSSPKWVIKLLVSPMTTSRNKKKVFPSRVGSRKRLTRFNSADWSYPDANGETHWIGSALRAKEGAPHNSPKVDEMDRHQRRTITTVRSSVLSWLQDADRTKIREYEPTGQRSFSSSSSGSTDLWLRDLTVGHLHEIVEESELEDEVVPTNSLGEISSFGNFLLSAAQRQPQAGLTRISSAA